MKRVWKGLAILATAVVICGVIAGVWSYFYTADLPATSQLHEFDPAMASEARLRLCDGSEAVIPIVPHDNFGNYVLSGVVAAEGQPDSRSPFRALIADFASDVQPRVGRYSWEIARSLVCNKPSRLGRQFEEVRVANAIERKFNHPQILTMYLNRVYLSTNTYGIEAGANLYFGKHASDLSLEEAALLVGLIRAPNRYSPKLHPERAIERRNSVLDEMVNQGSVSRADADRAKTIGLRMRGDLQQPVSLPWNSLR